PVPRIALPARITAPAISVASAARTIVNAQLGAARDSRSSVQRIAAYQTSVHRIAVSSRPRVASRDSSWAQNQTNARLMWPWRSRRMRGPRSGAGRPAVRDCRIAGALLTLLLRVADRAGGAAGEPECIEL